MKYVLTVVIVTTLICGGIIFAVNGTGTSQTPKQRHTKSRVVKQQQPSGALGCNPQKRASSCGVK